MPGFGAEYREARLRLCRDVAGSSELRPVLGHRQLVDGGILGSEVDFEVEALRKETLPHELDLLFCRPWGHFGVDSVILIPKPGRAGYLVSVQSIRNSKQSQHGFPLERNSFGIVGSGTTPVHLQHLTGSPNPQGWTATAGRDHANYLSFGPYYSGLEPGDHIAVFSLSIGATSSVATPVVRLDVNDATVQQSITYRDIAWRQFIKANRFEYFSIPFHLDSNHKGRPLEFRVYWFGGATMTLRLVGIS